LASRRRRTELNGFYCEQAAGFCIDVGNKDEGYFYALVRIFEQALKFADVRPTNGWDALVARLDRVRETSRKFEYAIGDDMDFLLGSTRGVEADSSVSR
jgi:hypothetical protein